MRLFSATGKEKKRYSKFGLLEIFREPVESRKGKESEESEEKLMDKFVSELAQPMVSYKAIKDLSWNGIPHCLRPKIWKYLLRYAPIHCTEDILTKKRVEYETFLGHYWEAGESSEAEKRVRQTIEGDVKRIGSQFNAVLKEEKLQLMLTRMLYIWHMRHPASGYVQGMCDLVNPFLIVFLSEYMPLDTAKMEFKVSIEVLKCQTLLAIEADMFWCTSKMLEYVITNYTAGFGGLHQAYSQVQELLHRIDEELFRHLTKERIDLFSLSFKNISTMLLRLFNPLVGVRLFDTYIAYESEYPSLIIFILIAVLEKYAKKMLELRSDELMIFVQKLPTKQWGNQELEILIAEAYVYKKLYQPDLKP